MEPYPLRHPLPDTGLLPAGVEPVSRYAPREQIALWWDFAEAFGFPPNELPPRYTIAEYVAECAAVDAWLAEHGGFVMWPFHLPIFMTPAHDDSHPPCLDTRA